MDNIREHIYLAALLHDIGKFYQRADTGSVQSSHFLNDHCKEERLFCPQSFGKYTHKHVLWTAQFIEDNKPVFQNLVKNAFDDFTDKNNLINLAAGHHLPMDQLSDLGKIIKEADSFSSGMDRDSEIALKDDQDEYANWNSFKKKRMTSILEKVNLNKAQLEDKNHSWYRLPVCPISLDINYFPNSVFVEDPDYITLWKQFINEFKFIQANTYHAFSETFLNLLFKYTTCIPSSTVNLSDVSLYDHLKTTAALAVCLYDVQQSKENPEDPFLLIGADFSGIQPYIYQIVSKYAGKNLKGRSFYLRILSDVVVRFILKELQLFQANIIYNSGGGFYMLAPNTTNIKNRLANAVSIIEESLFKTHGVSLFVAIDSIPLSKNALMHKNDENLRTVWKSLFDKRDKKKSCKFVSQIENNYNSFFNPIMYGVGVERDIITGEEIGLNEKSYKEGELGPLNKSSFVQIQLGKSLRESDVMVVSNGQISYWKDKNPIEPLGLDIYYYFLKRKDLEERREQLRVSADKISVITLNGKGGNCDFIGDTNVNSINNIYGLEFYGGNEIEEKGLSTFEEMCNKHESEDAFKRLGVLRMDVDNLGNIFQKGILPELSTLSRYAALSRSFDYFFSGYLNTIWRKIAPAQSFIIYSGGDDVFIVGSWEIVIKIAKRVCLDFRKFACNNPAFSISGGIAIVPAKFPIMKGAEESAIEEDNSKHHLCEGVKKNSISFMDTPLNWDDEFPVVEELKDNIVKLSERELLPKSFIAKVLAHAENAKIKNHKITVLKTYWMLTYDLSRMLDRVKDSEVKLLINNCNTEICKKIETIGGKPVKSNYHPLELWAFACRWAELEIRTNK